MRTPHGFLLAAILATPAYAADGKLSLSSGLDYSTGDYGTGDTTQVWAIPVNLKYRLGNYSFNLGMSYLNVRGKQTITPDGEPIVGGGTVQTTHGAGDVTASATVANVIDDRDYFLGMDLTAKIKFGTADEQKGLGSGENDYALQASFFKTLGNWTPYLDLGYRWKGDPVGIDYRNVWYGTAGSSYRLSAAWSVGGDYSWRERLTTGGDAVSEVSIFADYKLTANNKLNLYGVAGFSNASPDWGAGMTLSHGF